MNKKIIFLHIPKTGGRTLNYLFREYYSEKTYIDHIENLDPNKISKVIQEKLFVSGHISFFKLKRIIVNSNDWHFITFVREPFTHLISHISWVKNLWNNPSKYWKHPKEVRDLCDKIRRVDFSDLKQIENFVSNLDEYGLTCFENSHVRYLSNSVYGIRTTETHLEESLEVIKSISHVGVFENFKSSVRKLFLSFNVKLSEKQMDLKINNENNKVIQNIHSDKKVKRLLLPLVQKDLELYKACLKLI